jgi:glycosyltransferase involved in cell wall biosynthesis
LNRPHYLSPKKETARVIFFAKNFGGPGISNIGLGVTNQNNISVLTREGYFAEIWSGQTYEEVYNQIKAANDQATAAQTVRPSHVIINSPSWITSAQIATLSYAFPHICFILQNHTGCAYLSIDKNKDESGILANRKVIDLQRATINVKVSGNNTRFVNWLKHTYRCDCLYLPNLYDTASFVNPYPRQRSLGDTIRIGSFGAPRPWKNQLTAAMAAFQLARHLGKKLELYVNSRRDYQRELFQSRLDLFSGERDAKIIDVPWEPWSTFKNTVAHMDILFQPSFDETFNVVTADGIAMGVPSVVGSSIEWAPSDWMATCEDPTSLVKTGLYLLNDTHAVEDGRAALAQYVKVGLEQWKDLLGR